MTLERKKPEGQFLGETMSVPKPTGAPLLEGDENGEQDHKTGDQSSADISGEKTERS